MSLYIVIVVLAGLAYSLRAEAQYNNLTKGDKIRAFAPSIYINSVVGEVADVSSTGIIIHAKDSNLTLPFSSIDRLDVSRGKKRNIGKGALIGLGTGALGGGLIGAVTYKECNGKDFSLVLWYLKAEVKLFFGVLPSEGSAVWFWVP